MNRNNMNFDASEISPGIWLGSFRALCNNAFIESQHIKVIINCSPTYKFLNVLHSCNIPLPSDLIILSLDPSFDQSKFSEDERALLDEYMLKFNRILQNYLSFFYTSNPQAKNMIHDIPGEERLSISTPVLTGNLFTSYFLINRLIKLLRNVNTSMGVFIVSEDGNSSLSTSVAISYLMDSYSFNLDASICNIRSFANNVLEFNLQYYDDLLIVQSLKKFYIENQRLKEVGPTLMTKNDNLKRKNDIITVGGISKKKK